MLASELQISVGYSINKMYSLPLAVNSLKEETGNQAMTIRELMVLWQVSTR